ncbi:MAG: dienelactone hydrolase family protein [Lactobacillaceae bacterium]|nr:dienelactone hydrolase family protein [Lactobacillaceae bacterium]
MAKKTANIRHAYVSGDPELAPMLLLHGTGGDETDMLELAEFFGADNPKISLRGRVNENGLNRFFERYEDGSFNLASLHEEAAWLFKTIMDLAVRYDIEPADLIVIGYSNGSNIAAQMMLDNPQVPFKTAAFFHPMLIEAVAQPVALTDAKIFMSYGEFDPIVTEENFNALADNFHKAGAHVSTFMYQTSHGMSQAELQAAKLWMVANSLVEPVEEDHHHHHHD